MNTMRVDDLIPTLPPSREQDAVLRIRGCEYKIPLLLDSMGKTVLDMRNFFSETGCLLFDPSFSSTASCMSTICYIDGDKGSLFYRGYRIEELARHSTYIETSYLLLYGSLPAQAQLKRFEAAVIDEMLVHDKIIDLMKGFKSSSSPMSIMVGAVGALQSFVTAEYNICNPSHREEIAIKTIAKMATLAAYAYRTSRGYPMVYPRKDFSYMKNVLYMMLSNPMDPGQFNPDPKILRALEAIWICHAEHQQNPSTTSVRIAGSAFAKPFACIAAGIGSLWGLLHGGANEAVLTMLQDIVKRNETASSVLRRAKDPTTNFKLMGFGHSVYKNFDPRGKIMQEMYESVLEVVPMKDIQLLIQTAKELERQALEDKEMREKKLFPNVDFYTGLVFKALRIPSDMFAVMFSVARSAGWITHWCELMSEIDVNSTKIIRPRQLYVGLTERKYEPIEKRPNEVGSRIRDIVKENELIGLPTV